MDDPTIRKTTPFCQRKTSLPFSYLFLSPARRVFINKVGLEESFMVKGALKSFEVISGL